MYARFLNLAISPLDPSSIQKRYFMSGVLNDLLIYEILSVVSEIPEGRVASYGQIADLIGRSKNA